MSGQHSSSETAVRVRRLEERLIGAGLTSDEQLDGITRAGPVRVAGERRAGGGPGVGRPGLPRAPAG